MLKVDARTVGLISYIIVPVPTMFWQAAAYVELRSTCGVWAVWFQVYLKPISKCLNISQSIHIYNQIIQTYPKHFGVTASHSWTNSSNSHVLISLSLSKYIYARILVDMVKVSCAWCSYFDFSFHAVRTLEQGKCTRKGMPFEGYYLSFVWALLCPKCKNFLLADRKMIWVGWFAATYIYIYTHALLCTVYIKYNLYLCVVSYWYISIYELS